MRLPSAKASLKALIVLILIGVSGWLLQGAHIGQQSVLPSSTVKAIPSKGEIVLATDALVKTRTVGDREIIVIDTVSDTVTSRHATALEWTVTDSDTNEVILSSDASALIDGQLRVKHSDHNGRILFSEEWAGYLCQFRAKRHKPQQVVNGKEGGEVHLDPLTATAVLVEWDDARSDEPIGRISIVFTARSLTSGIYEGHPYHVACVTDERGCAEVYLSDGSYIVAAMKAGVTIDSAIVSVTNAGEHHIVLPCIYYQTVRVEEAHSGLPVSRARLEPLGKKQFKRVNLMADEQGMLRIPVGSSLGWTVAKRGYGDCRFITGKFPVGVHVGADESVFIVRLHVASTISGSLINFGSDATIRAIGTQRQASRVIEVGANPDADGNFSLEFRADEAFWLYAYDASGAWALRYVDEHVLRQSYEHVNLEPLHSKPGGTLTGVIEVSVHGVSGQIASTSADMLGSVRVRSA